MTLIQALRLREEAKVLHLVRDVRAVVNSRLRIDGFCLHHGAPGCAEPVCNGMVAAADANDRWPLSNGRSVSFQRHLCPQTPPTPFPLCLFSPRAVPQVRGGGALVR